MMQKKQTNPFFLYIMICCLLLVGSAILLLASFLKFTKKQTSPPPPQVILSMQNEQDSDTSQGKIAITINTLSHTVTGVAFTLNFDPSIVIDDITPGDFFASPTLLTKKIDNTTGQLMYVLSINLNTPGTNGKGILAEITYHRILLTPPQSAVIYFSDTPKIIAQGQTTPLITQATGIELK